MILRFSRFALLPCLLLLGSCSEQNSGPEVVLYSSVDESYSRKIAKAFEEETGIKVRLVSDTEAAKSTGLVNRLLAEKERPVADVFWSGDLTRAALIRKWGLSTPIAGADPEAHFLPSAARLRMIIVNREKAPKNSARPKSLLDLAKPEFAPSSCLANPLFGTTSMHAAALFTTLGEEQARAFFEDFTKNGGTMLGSNGEVKRRVANGEYSFGLTDSDDIAVALSDGREVDYLVPDQEGKGTLLIPCAAVLIKEGPNPEQGSRLVEFLGSPTTESLMAESLASHFPLANPDIAPPPIFGFRLNEVKTYQIDPETSAASLEKLQEGFLKRWVENQRSP